MNNSNLPQTTNAIASKGDVSAPEYALRLPVTKGPGRPLYSQILAGSIAAAVLFAQAPQLGAQSCCGGGSSPGSSRSFNEFKSLLSKRQSPKRLVIKISPGDAHTLHLDNLTTGASNSISVPANTAMSSIVLPAPSDADVRIRMVRTATGGVSNRSTLVSQRSASLGSDSGPIQAMSESSGESCSSGGSSAPTEESNITTTSTRSSKASKPGDGTPTTVMPPPDEPFGVINPKFGAEISKAFQNANPCVRLEMSTGRGFSGRGAPKLVFQMAAENASQVPTRSMIKTSMLRGAGTQIGGFNGSFHCLGESTGGVIYTDADGLIREVRTMDVHAIVADIQGGGFEVRFYRVTAAGGGFSGTILGSGSGSTPTTPTTPTGTYPPGNTDPQNGATPEVTWRFHAVGGYTVLSKIANGETKDYKFTTYGSGTVYEELPDSCASTDFSALWDNADDSSIPTGNVKVYRSSSRNGATTNNTIVDCGPDNIGAGAGGIPIVSSPDTVAIDIGTGHPEIPVGHPNNPTPDPIPGSDGTVTTVASTGYYTKETITPNAYASVRDITILRPLPFGVVPNVDAANADVTNCDATLIHHEDNASGWSRDWTRKLAGVQVERHYATQTTAVHAFPPGGLPAQQVDVVTDMHFGSDSSAAKVSVQKTISPLAADTRLAGLPVYRLAADGTVTDYNYSFGVADVAPGVFNSTGDGTDVRTEATVYSNGRTTKYITIINDGETVFEESSRLQDGTSYLVSRVAHGYTDGFRTLSKRETTTGWQTTYSAHSNGHFLDWEMGEEGVVTTNVDLDADNIPDRFIRAAVPAASGRPGVPQQVRNLSKDCFGWNWEIISEDLTGATPLSKRTWKVDEDGAIEEEVLNDWLHTRTERTNNADLTQSVSVYQRKYGTAVGSANERLISIRTTDREGRVLSVTGDGVVPENHAHSVTASGLWKEIVTGGDATDNIIAERSWETNGTGRSDSLPSGGANFRTYGFDVKGRVTSVSDAGNLVSQSAYNDATGAVTHTTLAVPDPSVVSTQSISVVESDGKTWQVSTTIKGTETSIHKRRVGLLDPDMMAQSVSIFNGVATTSTTMRVAIAGSTAFEVVETETPAGGVSPNSSYTKAGVEVATFDSMGITTTKQVDAIGRATFVSNTVGTNTTNTYRPFNQFGGALLTALSRGTDIAGTPNAVSTTTTFSYYDADKVAAGRVFSRTTDTMTTYFSHTAKGQQRATWGATYPVRYTYDGAGRLKQMETFKSDPSAAGATSNPESWPAGDKTTWEYWPATNLLKQKRDAANVGALYAYDNRGRMRTRTWARGVVTTYGYNTAGQMRTTTYSDGTPAVNMTHDAQGRVATLTDGTGTRTFAYDQSGRRLGEQYTAGRVDGLHFVHDPAGREVGYALTDEAGWATWQGWGYHANGRQSGVMTPEGWVGYSYSPLSGWPSARSYSATLDAIHYVNINNEVWSDGLGRLTRIETNGLYDSTIVNTMSRTYAYNTKGQRNKVTYENGDYVDYTYNARNEVTGGTKKYGLRTINDGFNGVTVQNLPHTYTFDAIGSRTADATIYGGRSIINNNALNQPVNEIGITNRIKLNGAGTPGSTIVAKVNNTAQPVTRARDGAWAATGSQTLMSHQWAPVSVTETIATVATEKIGKKHFPPHTGGTVFGYDTDGNQTTDARWNHTWDGENRLTKSETLAAAATAGVPRERITYTYDAQWRRATKKVETKATATVAWVIQTHMRYAYEGWNLIAEWDIKTSPVKLVRTHHWGIDLSGTRSGAGGVGGLVMTRHHTLAGVNGSKATIPAYDGTGNILAYLDTADGKKVAEYEYGPFGEPLRETGPLAKAHPHRWSSKYTDEETGFSYYGYRYYVPQSGRWLSRDPIEERGGLGLYGFVYNNTNFWIDIDGRLCVNPGTLIGAPAGPPGMAIGTAVGWVVIGAWAVIAGGDQGPTTIQPSIPDPNPNPPPQPEPDPKPSGPNYNPTLRAQCDELMANYKKIPQEPIPPLKKPAGSEAYCENLAKRIDRMARGIAAREAFGAAGCDSDSAGWNNPAVRPFPDNKTEAQRRADHEAQLRELRESLKKMQDLYKKYCTPC